MIEKKDVEKLALLSRIEVSEEEKGTILKDLEAILGYVSDVQKVMTGEAVPVAGQLYNVMREDGNPHEPGAFSEEILAEAPSVSGRYVKVKKIL